MDRSKALELAETWHNRHQWDDVEAARQARWQLALLLEVHLLDPHAADVLAIEGGQTVAVLTRNVLFRVRLVDSDRGRFEFARTRLNPSHDRVTMSTRLHQVHGGWFAETEWEFTFMAGAPLRFTTERQTDMSDPGEEAFPIALCSALGWELRGDGWTAQLHDGTMRVQLAA